MSLFRSTANQKGFAPVLLLVAALALVSFFALSTLLPFKDKMMSQLYPKDSSHAAGAGFVTRSGTKFMLDGKEFRFIGFNLFDAANTYFPEQGLQGYSCPRDNGWWSNIYTEAKLDQEMAYVKQQTGANVLRFWAFQTYTKSGTDWSGIDKVIRVAKKNGMKIIPVLEDGPGYCTQPHGQAKWAYAGDTWYTDGYKLKMGNYAMTYPDYVRAIVTRYKDEPAIFSWMMMNEADTSRKLLPDGTTKIDGAGPSVLVNFAKDIGGIIKAIDSNHLVTLGTQSNGANGASGKDFVDVYGIPELDYTEVHDWGYWADINHNWSLGEQNALPGSIDNKTLPNPDSADCLKQYGAQIACSIANSLQKLNKPIIVGEGGTSTKRWSAAQRAALLDNKIKAFFDVGGAGYLVWQWNSVVDAEGFDVLMSTNDPLLPKLKIYSDQFAASVPVSSASINPTASPISTATPLASIAPSPSPVIPSPSAAGAINFLQNSSFETAGGTGQALFPSWWLEIKSGGAGSLSQDTSTKIAGNSSAKINITQTDDWWKLQLYQQISNLTPGKKYNLQFSAKASVNRTVPIVFQQNAAPNAIYMQQDFNLTTAWRQYNVTYTPSVGNNTIFVFNLGTAVGTVWLDGVSLTEADTSPLAGDIVVNGKVDIFDYNKLLSDFGKTGTELVSDIYKAGSSLNKVDIFDFNLLLTNFGKTTS